MIDSHATHDHGVDVMDMHGILDNIETEFVRDTVGDASFHSATGEPHRVAASVMVAAVVGGAELALAVDSSTELTSPNDQGLVQEAALA